MSSSLASIRFGAGVVVRLVFLASCTRESYSSALFSRDSHALLRALCTAAESQDASDLDSSLICFFFANYFFFGSLKKKADEIIQRLVDVYLGVRRHPALKDVPVGFIFENNLGHEHSTLTRVVKRMKVFDHYFIFYEVKMTPGIRTDHQLRLKADDLLNEYVKAGRLAFYENLLTTDKTKTPRELTDMIITQMRNMQEITKTDMRGNRTRYVFSILDPKTKARIKERKDDMQRALGMLMYCIERRRIGEPRAMNWNYVNNAKRVRPGVVNAYADGFQHMTRDEATMYNLDGNTEKMDAPDLEDLDRMFDAPTLSGAKRAFDEM